MQIVEFIRRSIRSIWALELLLVIRREPLRLWSANELVGELRASEAVVSGVLAGFEQDGLVAREGPNRFRFAPAMKQLDELCDALADAYRQRPVAVINAISAPDDRLAALANAFRLNEPPP